MKKLFGPMNKSTVVRASDPRCPILSSECHSDLVFTVPSLAKYDLDLFFIAPFYHKLFPRLDKVIVLDLDLEFR